MVAVKMLQTLRHMTRRLYSLSFSHASYNLHVHGLYDFVPRLEIAGFIMDSVTGDIAMIYDVVPDAGRMCQLPAIAP
jgi:hypothetical protein